MVRAEQPQENLASKQIGVLDTPMLPVIPEANEEQVILSSRKIFMNNMCDL